MFDMIWSRWFLPEASNYAGGVQTCSGITDLGEVNDEELNRLDWELEKGFNEALQSEKDFMDGVRVGFLKNMTKLPFNLAGFVLNSREIQDMPDKLESSDVEDEGAYLGGKITADVVTTVLGIIGIVSGVGQMVTGLAGDVGGGALCASGVGIPAGVDVDELNRAKQNTEKVGKTKKFGEYEFKDGIDIDLRGKGTCKDAVDLAFEKTGVPREEFEVTKWGKDKEGKSFPVEWRANNGAEVNIDTGHSLNSQAPTSPHVGWQTGGKRGTGGAVRGHIFIDDVPYNR